ncbi:MAG: hypothetical protein V1855_03915 [bacterium]
MNLGVFLKKAQEASFWKDKNVFCFQGDEYPFFFFYELVAFLQANNMVPFSIKKLSSSAFDCEQLKQLLSQSLLGQQSFYWLGNVDHEKSKSKEKVLEFLLQYQGPHSIAFFISDQVKINKTQNVDCIEINQGVSYIEFKDLSEFFKKNISKEKFLLVKKLFLKIDTIPLHVASSFLGYLELINVRLVEELFDYLSDNMLGVEPSLFQLSEYFFSIKSKAFFKLWSDVHHKYSDMFWIAYWSEQFWRASHVITYLNNHEFAQAKKMSFRLPYGYIKQDWKQVNKEHLGSLFQDLYDIDFARKKGVSFSGAFDLMYCKHFLRYK